MSSGQGLWVGGRQVSRLSDGWEADLVAAFTDDMLCAYRNRHPEFLSIPVYGDEDVIEYSLRGSGRVIAERLNLLGYTQEAALEYLAQAVEEQRSTWRLLASKDTDWPAELDLPDHYTAADWVRDVATTSQAPMPQTPFGDMAAPLRMLAYGNPCLALRAALLAMPDAEVVFVIGHGDPDDAGEQTDLQNLCADALDQVQATASAHAPVVVLTEGHSDVAILGPALALLYPHLTDLVRFMDYSNSPKGGAPALVATVRAFAAARIANPVIALFDNDTAASDALRPLDRAALPHNIKVLQYPPLEMASNYPTLGPPTLDAPAGHLSHADVNGTAGSIEIYLGRDVLTLPNGGMRPVQWRSYINGSKQYQGEITGKKEVHDAFHEKLTLAQANPELIETQDWDGIRKILDLIVNSTF
ncbi:hypothetical protein ADK53_34030 [Streptomyces sp. WM6373]|uniref:hypothetical protein n=1 Tax=Streptomyces sp. WM6373 TaxID=1415556 RepID=UPI0006ADA55E|nr:hypothetical protein [Streptomyces sp. WM6373]KOU28535.1 hypothetical protein ADK53_34030 [Streptomyces sp. WM6373]